MTDYTSSENRICVVNRLIELLNDEMETVDILRIESSCYNQVIEEATSNDIYKCWSCDDFRAIYSRTTARVITHFDQLREASDIMNKLWSGAFDIDRIAFMTHEELMPDRNKKLVDALNIRKSQKIEQKVCTIYRCPKCGSRAATARDVQLRALDEGSNIKAKCTICSHEWIAF